MLIHRAPINIQLPVRMSFSYTILFSICYISGYYYPSAVLPISIILVAWSYFLIITKSAIEPVILLAMFARAIVGFSAQGNNSIYLTLNVLTNYLPIIVFAIVNLKNKNTSSRKSIFTTAYIGVLLLYFLIGLPNSMELFTLRIIPMMLLLLFFYIHPVTIDYPGMLLALRAMMVCSLILALTPDYAIISLDRLQDGTVFGKESDFLPLLGIIPRAMGPWWDPRIMGLFGVIYLVVALTSPKARTSTRRLDILIAMVVTISTLSRGAIATSLIVLISTILAKEWKKSPRRAVKASALTAVVCAIIISIIYTDYIEPIIIVGGDNPFSQRADFSGFAWNSFIQSPLGKGVGAMRNISTGVDLGYALFDSVTDAFLLILLAEIGIIGFILFILSFKELAWGRNITSKALFTGLLLQMTGTDIPDFGPLYYAAMMLIIITAKQSGTSDLQHQTNFIATENSRHRV